MTSLESSAENGRSIGIDLGTTHCCAAYYSQKGIKFIEHDANRLLPSIVTFESPEKYDIDIFKEGLQLHHPKTTIYQSKRFIGISFEDDRVKENAKYVTYNLIEHEGKVCFKLDFENNQSRIISPEEVSTILLKDIRDKAEKVMAEEVTKAVVTVPANFDFKQREATKTAAKNAGFKSVQILNEPTAAAIAYGCENNLAKTDKTEQEIPENVLVFDLGGGTFDISIVKVLRNNYDIIASDGDSHLGGADFDNCIFEYFRKRIKKAINVDVDENIMLKARLTLYCEKLKEKLSTYENPNQKYAVRIQNFINGQDISIEMSNHMLKDICQPLFNKTEDTLKEILKLSGLDTDDIDRVIMVGGSSKMRYFSESVLNSMFERNKICKDLDSATVVALGATIQALRIFGDVRGNIKQISEHPLESINISDVTSQSLGIEDNSGKFVCIIKKNTKIPTDNMMTFTTVFDNQRDIIIHVLVGENEEAKKNQRLRTLHFQVAPKPTGKTRVIVKFSINEEGILTVNAKESQSVTNNTVHVNYMDWN